MDLDNNENHENSMLSHVFRFSRQFSSTWPPLKKRAATASAFCTFFFLLFFALVFSRWIDASIFYSHFSQIQEQFLGNTPEKTKFSLNCSAWEQAKTCPRNYPTFSVNPDRSSTKTCPDYFRWIHEDLQHWRETGITREMMEVSRGNSNFRLVVLSGRVYVEKYSNAFQTRDLFTLWGIVQLARRYPGRLPDLELMFNCDDPPVTRSNDYKGPNAGPPPLFRYCSAPWSLDIVFPDWSFWGWVEVNIKPWKQVLKDIKEGNQRVKWEDRVPLAYWRGNPYVSQTRQDLMKCNSDKHEWGTDLYSQDWGKETAQGFKESNLEDQCTHRYKIYVEGRAWSVSEKYILACNSPTLYVTSSYHDFFTRGLVPLQHYWPIRDNNKCKSLKFAVEWGNNHTATAQVLGEAGTNFTQEDLKMDYVYDYMFHLLNQYAKLLKFKPSMPANAAELCSEAMACAAEGVCKKFMLDTLEESPSNESPCALPPPYDPPSFKAFLDEKHKSIEQVETWENEYWDKQKQ